MVSATLAFHVQIDSMPPTVNTKSLQLNNYLMYSLVNTDITYYSRYTELPYTGVRQINTTAILLCLKTLHPFLFLHNSEKN